MFGGWDVSNSLLHTTWLVNSTCSLYLDFVLITCLEATLCRSVFQLRIRCKYITSETLVLVQLLWLVIFIRLIFLTLLWRFPVVNFSLALKGSCLFLTNKTKNNPAQNNKTKPKYFKIPTSSHFSNQNVHIPYYRIYYLDPYFLSNPPWFPYFSSTNWYLNRITLYFLWKWLSLCLCTNCFYLWEYLDSSSCLVNLLFILHSLDHMTPLQETHC